MEILNPFLLASQKAVQVGYKAVQAGYEAQANIENNPRHKKVLAAIIGGLLVVNSFTLKNANEDIAVASQAVECATPICINPKTGQPEINPDYRQPAAGEASKAEPKKRKEKTEYILPEEYRSAEKRIDAMDLSVEGYLKFLTELDTAYSYVNIAKKYTAFNPAKFNNNGGGIRQRQDLPLETVIFHYTTKYYNQDGPSNKNDGGKPAIRRMLLGQNRRNGDEKKQKQGIPNPNDSCCGFHQLVDRDARVYMFAPHTARLAHASEFNPTTYGIEAEAGSQGQITAKQLEKMVYSAFFILQAEGKLDPGRIDTQIQGHGEMNDRVDNPADRNDFNAPVMRYLRNTKIKPFLRQNPGLSLLKPDLPKIK